jgi:branched-chain amino acid transport system ATP-binding protein
VLNLITAEFPADAGSVTFHGKEILGRPSFEVCRARIARTFQLVRVLPHMTTRENVMLGRMFGAEPTAPAQAGHDADQLLKRVGMAAQAGLHASQLTYIDQKRIELARALATRPQLLLLDEWLAGLNPTELRTGIALIEQVRKEGRTIIIVEHVMDAIRSLCDRCVVMSSGVKIAEGTPKEVLADHEVIRAYLGDADA